ncbi:hypothetical protein CTAYLR_002455 [Chrysophaeum taylorii]|uniref:Uncharacterized protein n=1 Tax=Chrysophaeum taylorii TaxID=2483200 RepID=A0AAD7XMJ7_9STRA|nr:hypothetical protein CTAYLR_002455 [Chrysophaeum taylorii]
MATSSNNEFVRFVDASCGSISIVTPVEKIRVREKGVETVGVAITDGETSTTWRSDAETQTTTTTTASPPKEEATLDEGCRAAVSRLGARALAELARDDSHVFEGFAPLSSGLEEVTYKYGLRNPKVNLETSRLQCEGVSWNATGNMLCAVYGVNYGSWCDEAGSLCCWWIFDKKFDPAKPSKTLEHPSCLTAVTCHPKRPSVVAVGSVVAEVMVYDLTAEHDELVATSEIAETTHIDSISALEWIQRPDGENDYDLVSISRDGKMLWWHVDLDAKASETVTILPDRGVLVARNPAEVSRPTFRPFGGTTISLFAMPPTKVGPLQLVVGTIGGRVLKLQVHRDGYKRLGKILGPKKLGGRLQWDRAAQAYVAHLPQTATQKLVKHVEQFALGNRKALVTPADIVESKPKLHYIYTPPFGAVTEFEAHVGPVGEVAASPFHRNVFLSVGLDGCVQLFSAVQTTALVQIEKPDDDDDDDVNRRRARADGDTVVVVVPNHLDLDNDYLAQKRRDTDTGFWAADWSKVRPLVFAVASDDAIVRIYDLAVSDEFPSLELKIPVPAGLGHHHLDRYAKLLSIKFNPKQRDFLACGDAAGNVHVWQLPWHLANSKADELQLLQEFIDSHFFDDDAAVEREDDDDEGVPPAPKSSSTH